MKQTLSFFNWSTVVRWVVVFQFPVRTSASPWRRGLWMTAMPRPIAANACTVWGWIVSPGQLTMVCIRVRGPPELPIDRQ